MPRRRTNSAADSPPNYKKLVLDLKPLVTEIVSLQRDKKAAGLFADDRELLECPRCRLQEDLIPGGKLIRGDPNPLGVDTGLCIPSTDSKEFLWCCSRCGAEFAGEGFRA